MDTSERTISSVAGSSLAPGQDAIRWHHHILALPLKGLSALNIGPLGGENSISVVIEAVLAARKGQKVDFSLSKTERFFLKMLTAPNGPPIDQLLDYRELNHRAQKQALNRWGNEKLGVIWLGGGVFTREHPLIAETKFGGWHIWSDANPKVIETDQEIFDKMRQQTGHYNAAFSITLPQEIHKLNANIRFLAKAGIKHILLQTYGMFYVLTKRENMEWLNQLERPTGVEMSFILNSMPQDIPLMPAVMAAFHNQRMVYYNRQTIEAMFAEALPGSKIIWEIPQEESKYGVAVWLVHAPPNK